MFVGQLSLRGEHLNDDDNDENSYSDDDVDDRLYQGEAPQPEQPLLHRHHPGPRVRVAR